jgi:predicted ATPase
MIRIIQIIILQAKVIKMADEQRKIILTGGPGCGKTALLDFLVLTGHCNVCPEAPRIVFYRETAKAKDIPGYIPVTYETDLPMFEKYSMMEQISQEAKQCEKSHSNLIFLDRSLVDIIAYSEIFGIQPPKGIFKSLENAGYDSLVFLLSPLQCYRKDYMRRENQEEAKKVHEKLFQVYLRLGFDIQPLPPIGWDNRAYHIFEKLEQTPKRIWTSENAYSVSR